MSATAACNKSDQSANSELPLVPKFAMVAGETSGDLLAGLLLDGIKQDWPLSEAMGIGGVQMARRGFQAWWPSEKLAVRGYVEVLRHYLEIIGIRRQLKARLISERPSVFIGVDAPDFNLDLEKDLKSAGIKTVHFICPSIWAWRPERVVKIKVSVDHVLCIFPFEKALLEKHGIAASYVGHPLANVIPLAPDRQAARRRLGLGENDSVVALLPGSRKSEIRYLAHRFFKAAELMSRQRPELRFLLPVVPSVHHDLMLAADAAGMQERVRFLQEGSHEVLAACDVAMMASGTATLEAALFKRPMVIAYAMNPLTYWLMKSKQLLPWIGLPNILCRNFVVPELIQQQATPQNLARMTLAWLDDTKRVAELEQTFTRLHHDLQRDTSRLAVHAIHQVLAS